MLLLLFVNQEGTAQSTIKISGTVKDAETKQPVSGVSIYVKSGKAGTASDLYGRFSIDINVEDTLLFSSIGFENYTLHLISSEIMNKNQLIVDIEMNPRTYELDPVKVTAYPSIEQFKHDILALDGTVKEKGFKLDIPKDWVLPPEGATLSENSNPGFKGSLSGLYDAVGREARQKRKLEALRKQEADKQTIDARYNIDVVRRITNLNEEKAKQFMEWCKFEDAFILKSTDYELTVAMLKCLDEFPKKP